MDSATKSVRREEWRVKSVGMNNWLLFRGMLLSFDSLSWDFLLSTFFRCFRTKTFLFFILFLFFLFFLKWGNGGVGLFFFKVRCWFDRNSKRWGWWVEFDILVPNFIRKVGMNFYFQGFFRITRDFENAFNFKNILKKI